MTDASFFDATLAQLSQLTALRNRVADTAAPEGSRYPPQHFDFKMPPIRTSTISSEEREDYFSLTFKTLKAPVRKFTLHTSSVRTVAQVKRHLSRISNIPVATMRLVLNGKGLVDAKLIGDYAIQDNSVIQIISKPAGSAPTPLLEADELSVVDESVANPLSSALGIKDLAAQVRERVPAGYVSDVSSDGESGTVLSAATREQLQQKNGTFRNNLRETVHAQFSGSQAEVVDRLLDDFFATLK
ncbi:hypothetical protein GGH12_006019 [Coemansia sp. RSA 1822]|nr:hypothetical protein LPJ76_004634 [Coemansia sp. RSA 638]KAJ2125341.1 hypothetical protein IW147_000987 [Coemansia sp. RSA 720]KAJ2479315.1 hypothetical protein IWW56_003155 [Coemansia sp. RSA 2131]KAJ2545695.1 hypothetical protein GGF49_000204 [Coemansia sp. RSA 1853]KAJ2558029.1 hypothetical protein GGH12_006019 [Coemansia sp. RSA 1822]KAJ2656518.1 hypothetical protein IW148_005587 [Coemansia sp. RSA 1199]